MPNKEMAERARYLKTDPKGVEMMCKIMEDVKNEGLSEGKRSARIEDIKSVMDGLKYTAEQAMNLLKIPDAERRDYTSLL